mgnify:FL=1|tara:strand:- start:1763 stop:2809 length:1047 start_codon:yes stop_codon:yes gene_type:complete
MAYTTIDKPTDYFETTTYAGGTTAITSLDFSPDFVWAKKRSGAESHGLFDSVRGATKAINSDRSNAEDTRSGSLTSFDSNGWSMGGSDGIISNSGSTYVAWAWRGSDSSAASNTDGSITSTVSANTTAGFSIVKYTGTGSNATIGHGLGKKPDAIIVKAYEDAQQWASFWSPIGATKVLRFNTTNVPSTSSTRWNNTEPTSSVFSVGNEAEVNTNTEEHIAYCFTSIKGYSKIGTYTGNANTDGIFIYTGFRPAWVVFKNISTSNDWFTIDIKRDTLAPNNPVGRKSLNLNSSAAEVTRTTKDMDFVSNGIKLRTADGTQNNSGENYIYMAFAETPFVTSTGIPTTAR